MMMAIRKSLEMSPDNHIGINWDATTPSRVNASVGEVRAWMRVRQADVWDFYSPYALNGRQNNHVMR